MANPTDLEQFAERLCALMHTMIGKLLSFDRNYLARGILTIPQLFVLRQIAEAGKCSMSMIARELGFKSSTVTGMLDRLVGLGLVKRYSPENNRRQVLAEITSKGARILAQVQAERKRTLVNMFKLVSAGERAAYLSIIEKIAAQFSRANENKNGR